VVPRSSSLRHDNYAISEVIDTIILTGVMVIIVITASFYANDTLSFNVESVHFDQAINAVLSLEKVAKNIMFKPQSIGTVKTSFLTTDPYVSQMGTLAILIDGNEISSFIVNCFKVKGSERVGVSFSHYYLGDISYLSKFILVGLNGSISCVKKYQDNGAWVSLDYGRIRCVYCGEMNYYNGTNPEPVKRNVIEITAIKINSGGIDQFIDNSRIILKNTGIQTQQIEHSSGNFDITVHFSDKNDSVSLIDLGGNATLPTLINLTIVNFEITILGGG
jgi:hypothetical protein